MSGAHLMSLVVLPGCPAMVRRSLSGAERMTGWWLLFSPISSHLFKTIYNLPFWKDKTTAASWPSGLSWEWLRSIPLLAERRGLGHPLDNEQRRLAAGHHRQSGKRQLGGAKAGAAVARLRRRTALPSLGAGGVGGVGGFVNWAGNMFRGLCDGATVCSVSFSIL